MKKILKQTLIIMISAFVMCGFLFICTSQTETNAYAEDEKIFLGGMPIGIHAESPYFVIYDFANVVTPLGSYSPAQKAGLNKGDIILSINDKEPKNYNNLLDIISEKQTADFVIKRGKEIIKIPVESVEDIRNKQKKIGIIVKNDINGIGTVTYIREDGKFGALGHPIGDEFGYSDLYQKGTVYDCTIYGYNRAEKDKAGELVGQINTKKAIGTFYSNSLSGILGQFNDKPGNNTPIQIAKQSEVTPGKAYIYTTIDGKTPSMYEIEIIKAQNQPTEKEKSMVIRVTDPNLLKTTGGILQGMSGSPIIQNDKLVGAVTHVLTSETTIGYGIYIEWMMN